MKNILSGNWNPFGASDAASGEVGMEEEPTLAPTHSGSGSTEEVEELAAVDEESLVAEEGAMVLVERSAEQLTTEALLQQLRVLVEMHDPIMEFFKNGGGAALVPLQQTQKNGSYKIFLSKEDVQSASDVHAMNLHQQNHGWQPQHFKLVMKKGRFKAVVKLSLLFRFTTVFHWRGYLEKIGVHLNNEIMRQICHVLAPFFLEDHGKAGPDAAELAVWINDKLSTNLGNGLVPGDAIPGNVRSGGNDGNDDDDSDDDDDDDSDDDLDFQAPKSTKKSVKKLVRQESGRLLNDAISALNSAQGTIHTQAQTEKLAAEGRVHDAKTRQSMAENNLEHTKNTLHLIKKDEMKQQELDKAQKELDDANKELINAQSDVAAKDAEIAELKAKLAAAGLNDDPTDTDRKPMPPADEDKEESEPDYAKPAALEETKSEEDEITPTNNNAILPPPPAAVPPVAAMPAPIVYTPEPGDIVEYNDQLFRVASVNHTRRTAGLVYHGGNQDGQKKRGAPIAWGKLEKQY